MWEVVGFEKNVKAVGSVSFDLYVTKDFKPGENVSGKKARRFWYRVNEVNYEPVVGDLVVIETETRGKYEIVTDIWRAS